MSTPRIRALPEDFVVEELPLYAPSGEGGHTFVFVEKVLRNTEEVARDLARAAGVRPAEVGYAGRKDRVALTRQWLSVPGLDAAAALALELPGVRVLQAIPHGHKLRTGQLAGNRFALRVRDVGSLDIAAVEARLADAARHGIANRFGAQRFGRDGDNAERARALLRGERVRGGRRAVRFLVSALQAEIFNEVLDARPLALDVLERGDIAMRHASGGCFRVEDPAAEAPRLAAFEISPTGPVFGSKVLLPEGIPAEREREVLARHGIDLEALPRVPGLRLRGSRRSLRVRPEEATLEREPDALLLRFRLPPGSYATTVLAALLGVDPVAGPAAEE